MNKKVFPLQLGEKSIKNAPTVSLWDGSFCVPQHYLLYEHTIDSVEKIILDIDFDSHYPVFACEDKTGIYIQIGIVGYDNYQLQEQQEKLKLVYGRKWRVEKNLPTAEIIQTVFLAIKKAREHEIRELYKFIMKGKITTPFSNHHDIFSLARSAHCLIMDSSDKLPNDKVDDEMLQCYLDVIKYDDRVFKLVTVEERINGSWILDIKVESRVKSQLPEIKAVRSITLILETLEPSEMYYQLMDELIRLSDRYVDEHFRYKKFPRFSRKNNVENIAKLSSAMRKLNNDEHEKFKKEFDKINDQTDETRVPKLSTGQLSKKIIHSLESFGRLEGFFPR